jgi:macrodomain Ter protein organizer (MatP/YcbG family)
MHTLKLNIHDSLYDKVFHFLNSLPKNKVEILESRIIEDDWSHLESWIDEGLNSGMSDKSHEEIMADIKRKYA